MKVNFEFDTESENFDNCELERHYQANNMTLCLHEITNQIRSWYDYDERETIPVDEIHQKIWDIIQDHVNMERLGY